MKWLAVLQFLERVANAVARRLEIAADRQYGRVYQHEPMSMAEIQAAINRHLDAHADYAHRDVPIIAEAVTDAGEFDPPVLRVPKPDSSR